jgi:outer membrane protein assembly factor BamB
MPRPALAGLIIALLLLGPLTAADWLQWLGPTRNGVSSETGLRASWPRQGPPLVWQKEVGAGFSGPVVVGRRLVLFHRLKDEEVVECLDALTGDRKWRFAYPTEYQDDFGFDEGPRSTPTVAGSRVYTLGAAGVLHCLDLASGKKLWRRSMNEEYQVRKGYFGVGTSPLVEGGVVLVNVGAKKAGIVAFDKETGKEVWKATDDGASYSSPVVAAVAGKRSVFFLTRRGLVVLDPRTGAVRFDKFWRSRMDASVNAATPVVVGDDVFVSACYGTGALLLRFGKGEPEEVWKGDEILSNHYATSVHRGGYLYGFDGRQEQRARLRCVELKTGKVCWTEEEFGCGSMILADRRLIILSEDGDLVLVEATPSAYRERARARVLTSPCRAQIALADCRLYARDGKKLICVDLRK